MVERRPVLDHVFFALADPTRRGILDRLGGGSATVTEVAEPFPMSLAAVSKHVKVLEHAGLVRRDVRGREHHLSLDTEALREASAWIEHHRRFWEERLDALARYVEDA